ncbi:GMC family oxidoreductase [Nesterenkonia populi]|uniref:GMC family oxidoreductase n=1 Tax=Nesterenkonia populi TaxID=1591087 RepID=UPI0011BF28F9|nr:GMC family oxidoreductase [Nesterenkonia populi]
MRQSIQTADFDVLIIGAGSAGNVIARRLLDHGLTVGLLEAGGPDSNPTIQDVSSAGALWFGPEDWQHWTTEQPGCQGRRLHLPRGKVMGGSHALNAAIWMRGAKQDFDTWNYLGCPGWGWEEVLPVYMAIEKYDGGASSTRGGSGLLDVVKDYPMNPIQDSILTGAEEMGIPRNEDYNSGDVEGVSKMQLTIRDGKRFNTWSAYLKPVAQHPNLTILTEAHVRRLMVEEGQVTGVVFTHEGEEKTFRAGETMLTAGVIGSAEILLRSGIGPAEELREAGVAPVHDLPGVGKNLHDHLLAPVIYTTTAREVPAPQTGAAETHLFWKSRPDLAVPDTQPIHFALPMYSVDSMSGPENGFSLMGGLVRPLSRGELTLTGPDPEDQVRIDLGALTEQADVDSLVASVRQCRELGCTQALASWGPEELYPGQDVSDSEEDLEEYVRSTAVTYHHQVGTCRMGLDVLAVVDPRTFAVRGLKDLRVADASIMPLVPTGNTNAPTIMIAERAAAFLTGKDIIGAEKEAVHAQP